MEEHTGFEPAQSAWKAEMLPLHQCSMVVRFGSPKCGLSRTSHIVKEGRRRCLGLSPWRAEQDSNLLPSVVLPLRFLNRLLPIWPLHCNGTSPITWDFSFFPEVLCMFLSYQPYDLSSLG